MLPQASDEFEDADEPYLLAAARRLAGVGGWHWARGTKEVHWSEAVAACHGYGRKLTNLPPSQILQRYTRAARRRLTAAVGRCIRSGVHIHGEFELTVHRERRWIRLEAKAIQNLDGDVVGIQGACCDITHTRQLEHRAARLGRQLQDTLDTMSDAFLGLDRGWHVQFLNRTAERMLGHSFMELTGQQLWAEIPLLRGTIFEQEAHRARSTGIPVSFEAASPGPRPRWLNVRMIPSSEGLAVYFRDVTASRKAAAVHKAAGDRQRAAQKMESLGVLAGGIVHDFNNMLGAVLANLGLALEDLEGHFARERIVQAQRASLRARDLVQRILSFSRTGSLDASKELLALKPLVMEAAHLLRATLPADVELKVKATDDPLIAHVDATALQQVLLNLCTNAWHALPDGRGAIEVHLRRLTALSDDVRDPMLKPGQYAFLSVRDNGQGMDAETQARIFEPFFTTKETGMGTGLGLPVVRDIVEAHGGSIAVHSRIGRGSRFDVYLPALFENVENRREAAPTERRISGAGRCVMVVDDDPLLLMTTEHVLLRLGYKVKTFNDPHSAYTALMADGEDVEVLVTDLHMPGMSGLELSEHVHEIRPSLPVVLSSGLGNEELRLEAVSAGVSATVSKERLFDDLGLVVASILSRREPSS